MPVPIVDTSTCNIPPNSAQAAFLREQDLIVIDECSMVPKHALQAIDRMLRDICNSDLDFGGKCILLSGDFRQILPVVKRARPAEIIEVCLKSSLLWQNVSVFTLTQNMRARPEEQEFAQWLLQVGGGQLPLKPQEPFKDCIEVPSRCMVPKDVSIIGEVFNDTEVEDFASKVILCTTNDDSLEINEKKFRKTSW